MKTVARGTVLLGLLLVAIPWSVGAQSPYAFGGFRLPMTGAALRAIVGTLAKCSTDKPARLTTCKAHAFVVHGQNAGTYDLEWEVNDVSGNVSGLGFITLNAKHSTGEIDSLARQWGSAPSGNHGMFTWEQGNWFAVAHAIAMPNDRLVSIRDKRELKAVSDRMRALGR